MNTQESSKRKRNPIIIALVIVIILLLGVTGCTIRIILEADNSPSTTVSSGTMKKDTIVESGCKTDSTDLAMNAETGKGQVNSKSEEEKAKEASKTSSKPNTLSVNQNSSTKAIKKEPKISSSPKPPTNSMVLEHPDYGLSLVYVEGGSFDMGTSSLRNDRFLVHNVTLDGFLMSKYESTNKQYCAFLNEEGNQSEGGKEWINLAGSLRDEKCRIYERSGGFSVESGYEDHAVTYVSWYGARAYCTWLSNKVGREVRLPTEAEWEYAARGGKKSRGYTYSGSNTEGEIAWYGDNSSSKVHKVGGKSPNELGLYDMTGNVWEWCSDWYDKDYYSSCPSINPKGPSSGDYKVIRGGSWGNVASVCRVANRGYGSPDYRGNSDGFRVALSQ